MLGLDPTGRRSLRAVRDDLQRTRAERFAFGGVGFELLSAIPERASLADAYAACCLPLTPSDAIAADVACALRVEPGEPQREGPQPVGWSVQGEWARVQAPGVEARLCRLSPQRFALTGLLRPRPDALGALLRGASAAVLQQVGGLTLHAVGLELDGEAVLVMGPSGAGKSTAASLVPEARCFAHDHVALVRRPGGGWWAWALPGGRACALPLSQHTVLPLRAVLRVRRGQNLPSFHSLSGAEALFLVRESVESGDCSPGAEQARMAAAMRLSSEIQLGTVSTVLGHPMTAELRRFLGSGCR